MYYIVHGFYYSFSLAGLGELPFSTVYAAYELGFIYSQALLHLWVGTLGVPKESKTIKKLFTKLLSTSIITIDTTLLGWEVIVSMLELTASIG